jgi:hypothetical protein
MSFMNVGCYSTLVDRTPLALVRLRMIVGWEIESFDDRVRSDLSIVLFAAF